VAQQQKTAELAYVGNGTVGNLAELPADADAAGSTPPGQSAKLALSEVEEMPAHYIARRGIFVNGAS
jgi:hypothetical protein